VKDQGPPRAAKDESARISEAHVGLAVAAAGLGLWRWDVPAGLFTIDDRFAGMLGRPELAITPFDAQMVAEMTHPEDREMVARELSETLKHDEHVFRTTHRAIRPDGELVWLRARATNTSDWVLLPGRAAVYLGADFLGRADLPLVQRGAELALPLGVDAGLAVERVLLEDESGSEGVFRSRRTEREAWRVTLRNHRGLSARPDGAVAVIVHEALPRTRDDRIEVDLDRVEPDLAGGGRWDELREETGALTWVVVVPRGGARTIEHALELAYPEDETLVEEVER